jgi:hypothetical protein
MPRRLPILLAVAAALAPLFPSRAAVVVALDLPDLLRHAALAGVGTAGPASSRWSDGRIVTDTVVRIDDPLLGADGPISVVVRTLGGAVGDIGQWVPGEARLQPGDRYLLFLEPLPDGALRPVGLAQGALPIAIEDRVPMVRPPPDLPLLRHGGADAEPSGWMRRPRPLDEVLDEIRTAVASRAP